DGSVIHQILEIKGTDFGADIGSAGDVDLDGIPDFYVSAGRTYVRVYSGKTGLGIINHLPPPGVDFGVGMIANVGDVDRDGVPDLGWGAGGCGLGGLNSGILMVISNRTGGVLHQFLGKP